MRADSEIYMENMSRSDAEFQDDERRVSVAGLYRWTQFRLSLLRFLIGKGYLWGQVVVGLDNVMILLLNTSAASIGTTEPLVINILVTIIGGFFALCYVMEWVLSVLALREYLLKSPWHFLDAVVIQAKVATVVFLYFHFSDELAVQLAFPALMIYTGLRTIFRSNCKSYNTTVLRQFEGENLDFARVLSCLRQLKNQSGGENAGDRPVPRIDDSQLQKLEQLLQECADLQDGVIHASDLHKYLLMVGDCMPADVAARVATALSTVTVVVTVVECRNVLMKGPVVCMGSVRNADGRALSLLADKARMLVSYRTTKQVEESGQQGYRVWNEDLVFEGIPRETQAIRVDIREARGNGKGAYRLQVPISALRKGMTTDRWYEMDVRGRRDSEAIPKRIKLPKLHLRVRHVMSTFASQKALPKFYQESEDSKSASANVFASHAAVAAYGVGSVVRSTFSHWLPQWAYLLFGFFVLSAQAAVVPLTALVTQTLVDDVLKPSSNSTLTAEASAEKQGLLTFCLLALSSLYALGMISGFLIGWVQARVNANATMRLRTEVLGVVLTAGTKFHEQHSEGELSALFATDVSRVNTLWQSFFWNLLGPLFSILFAMGYLFRLSPNAGIMAYGFLAIVFSGGPKVTAAEKSREFSKDNASVTSEYQNAVQCEKVIRTYKISDVIMEKFVESAKHVNDSEFGMMFWASNMQQYIETTLNFFTTLQTVSLALQTFWGALPLGQFVAMTGLYASLVRPASSLGGFSRVALSNAGSLQRVDQVLRVNKKNSTVFKDNTHTRLARLHEGMTASVTETSMFSRPKDERLAPLLAPMPSSTDLQLQRLPSSRAPNRQPQKDEDMITFSHVFFKYQEAEPFIIDDFEATIPRGKFCCLTGKSGCGKSTLLSILMGFYAPSKGDITVDKCDLIDDADVVSQKFGVVFQSPSIFNGTILENIEYGKWGASRQECQAAAERAKCDFVWQLENKLDTVVGTNGVQLSGGQRQRICLARGLVRNPKILLLDEVTSALDGESEAAIIDTLEDLARSGMTIVSVTHRLKTCMRAHKILVLSKGKLVDGGTYEELMSKPEGLFASMVAAQERSAKGDSKEGDNKEGGREEEDKRPHEEGDDNGTAHNDEGGEGTGGAYETGEEKRAHEEGGGGHGDEDRGQPWPFL